MSLPDCQSHSQFAAAGDETGGNSDKRNSETCENHLHLAPGRSSLPAYQQSVVFLHARYPKGDKCI